MVSRCVPQSFLRQLKFLVEQLMVLATTELLVRWMSACVGRAEPYLHVWKSSRLHRQAKEHVLGFHCWH